MDLQSVFSDNQLAVIGCFLALGVCGTIAGLSFRFGKRTPSVVESTDLRTKQTVLKSRTNFQSPRRSCVKLRGAEVATESIDFAAMLENVLNRGLIASISFVEMLRWPTASTAWAVVFFALVTSPVFAEQLLVVLVLNIADMQKPISADTEIDKRGLNTRFDVDHLTLVDIANVVFCAAAFDVELFKSSIFNDCNPAFFRLQDVD